MIRPDEPLVRARDLRQQVDKTVKYRLDERVDNVWVIREPGEHVKFKMIPGHYYKAGEDDRFRYYQNIETGAFFAVEKDREINFVEVPKRFLFF